MAAAVNRLGFVARRYVLPSQNASRISIASLRPFSSSRDSDNIEPDERKNTSVFRPPPSTFAEALSVGDRARYDSLSIEDRERFEQAARRLRRHMTSPGVEGRLSAAVATAVHNVEMERPVVAHERFRGGGFMAMGEEDEEGTGPDDEFKEDDISSLAHAELEQHREMREYARLAAWEMPLLSKLAKPFVPPSKDQPLQFRYTTYLGEEHPAEKKVVLQFCTKDMLDLTEVQRDKLIKLVGVRYNPETDVVKMSCEMFETQAQNKRYLGDLVETLLREAKDPTDTFEDIPLDFRHHHFREKPRFPRHWRMTPERKEQLLALRQEREQRDQQRTTEGRLLDGVAIIEKSFAALPAVSTPLMEEAIALRGKGKGKAKLKR
ncbi:MAG: 37S ribosomal protein S24, mitochondrial [Trichoglossum hirsutum]|nr:MAG: 37S ribosomal protein S24, mitochondrial [Trichoglossum hirsutum]